MWTRDQRALFYYLVDTQQENRVFGFQGKYIWKANTHTNLYLIQTAFIKCLTYCHTNLNNILSSSNIPTTVDVSSPTASQIKYRHFPESPSNNSTFDYKQSLLNVIQRFLASTSLTLKCNSSVIQYLWDEISWDSFINEFISEKLLEFFSSAKPPSLFLTLLPPVFLFFPICHADFSLIQIKLHIYRLHQQHVSQKTGTFMSIQR